MKKVKIYTLEHPVTGEIRYVGKTIKSLNYRLTCHICDSKRYHTKRDNWIKAIRKLGMRPVISLIDEVDESSWIFEETFYISYFKYLGFRLVNHTSGGEGVHGYKHTKEEKERIRLRMSGKNSPSYGRKATEEELKMLRERIKKQKEEGIGIFSEESRAKCIRANISRTGKTFRRGYTQSEEWKKKRFDSRKITISKIPDYYTKYTKKAYKKVIQMDLLENFIKEFSSISEAGLAGFDESHVVKCCKGKCKKHKGFKWKYTES